MDEDRCTYPFSGIHTLCTRCVTLWLVTWLQVTRGHVTSCSIDPRKPHGLKNSSSPPLTTLHVLFNIHRPISVLKPPCEDAISA